MVGPEPLGPPPLEVRLDQTVAELWRARLSQAIDDDRYAGVPISKLPEDLRVYEQLIWSQRPECVVEIGIGLGGSGLWFRDRLRTLATYGHAPKARVIGIDIDPDPARERLAAADPGYAEEITILAGDVRDDAVAAEVARLVDGAGCLVIEDGAHTYETTLAGLRGYAGLVPPGGYFVVEDGVVDVEELRLRDDWPRGVLAAVDEWLGSAEGEGFELRRDLEIYGITSHPRGFLQRTAA